MYVSVNEVLATAGITTSEVSEDWVAQFILGAQSEVERLTNTVYWTLEDEGTATSATNNTLVDSGSSWSANCYKDHYLRVTGGIGEGQVRKISSNDSTTITVSSNWSVNPDATSTYNIHYVGRDPYVSNELRDGDNTKDLYLEKYPLITLVSASSNSTSVTTSSIYQYKDTGRLQLSSSSEVSYWTSKSSQLNVFAYYYGVYPIPYEVKRYIQVCAGLKCLMAQAGGTHNIPSTYSLPEGSISIGQAYINIRGAWDMLNKEKVILAANLIRYFSVG